MVTAVVRDLRTTPAPSAYSAEHLKADMQGDLHARAQPIHQLAGVAAAAAEVDRAVAERRYGEAAFLVRGQGFVTSTTVRRISAEAAAFEKVHERPAAS